MLLKDVADIEHRTWEITIFVYKSWGGNQNLPETFKIEDQEESWCLWSKERNHEENPNYEEEAFEISVWNSREVKVSNTDLEVICLKEILKLGFVHKIAQIKLSNNSLKELATINSFG